MGVDFVRVDLVGGHLFEMCIDFGTVQVVHFESS